MEALRKLERVQNLLSLMEARGISSGHRDADRFLADFLLFLVQPCGTLTLEERSRMISEFLPKISLEILDEACPFASKEDCQQIHTELPLQPSLEKGLECISKVEETSTIGLDAMRRANSTLDDFCRSYFMFHGMDANKPNEIFKYLPVLSFTESYIYQLDTLNEKKLHLSPKVTDRNVGNKKSEFSQADSVDPLVSLFQREGLLTERLRRELNSGTEYWALERKLCQALSRKKKILVEDVTRAIHLKSFDYRVLNLLLYQLRGQQVNEVHMEFLSISEYLVELADDLYDYEDDVIENSFNVLRMFVWIYGPSAAPRMLAKCITEAEEKYERLSRTLDPELSRSYWRRCAEATKEGGTTSSHAFGTWNIPPVIVDEEAFRLGSTQDDNLLQDGLIESGYLPWNQALEGVGTRGSQVLPLFHTSKKRACQYSFSSKL